ncbi:MAG: hypothetical protein K2R98_03990 [Gemmataceae bacterium]|nr:hypothetical protein [Gemmataceae bacterium]
MLTLDVEFLVFVPTVTTVHAPNIQHGLGSRYRLVHAGPLYAIFDQVATRSFDHPTGNRIADGQAFVVTHALLVLPQIDPYVSQRFLLGRGQLPSTSQGPQTAEDTARLASQDAQQLLPYKLLGLVALLVVKDMRRLPQAGRYMRQIQDIHAVGRIQYASEGEDVNRQVATVAKFGEKVVTKHHVQESDVQMLHRSNRTFERILASLPASVADQRGEGWISRRL